MFSEQLENLIKATLEDGMLEEYEKQALIKRAKAEDVDLTELEIYINSLLQKRSRELALEQTERAQLLAKKKQEAFGRVCPNCGKQISPLTLKCTCGFEFTKANTVSSITLLSEKIDKIMSAPMSSRNPDSESYKSERREREQRVRDQITMFPVPNNKEDIIEFLSLSLPNAKKRWGIMGTIMGRMIVLCSIVAIISILCLVMIRRDAGVVCVLVAFYGGIAAVCASIFVDRETLRWNKDAQVWRAKFEQVLMKGRSMRGDAEFQRQLDYYEDKLKGK